jgi:hypothetical protein
MTKERRLQQSSRRAAPRKTSSRRDKPESGSAGQRDPLRFNDVEEQIKRFFGGPES